MNIIGHTNILDFLQKAVNADRLAHAYLFSGPGHVGKTCVAEFFLNRLISESYPAQLDLQQPTLNQQRYPDFYYLQIEDGQEIKVEQVRELRANLQKTGLLAGLKKIVVIYQADRLNSHAANALLKILEEPMGSTIFILLANDLSAVPQTVQSRCVSLRFNLVPHQEIRQALAKKCDLHEQINLITAYSMGRPGLAISYLQSPQLFDKIRARWDLLSGLLGSKTGDSLIGLERVEQQEASELVDLASLYFRDQILSQYNLPELKMNHDGARNKISPINSALALVEISRFKKDSVFHLRVDYLLQKLFINL